MATSRTGTATWKRVRALALKLAWEQGQNRCPECRKPMDYSRSLMPNSAEVDHIIPHSQGGQDVIENCRVTCRQCNQRLGGKVGKQRSRKQQPVRTLDLDAAGTW